MGELKSGFRTSEFLATGVGVFLSALFALLTAFNVLPFTPEQQEKVYDFCAVAWMVLPGIYVAGRSHVKASALKGESPQTIVEQKVDNK